MARGNIWSVLTITLLLAVTFQESSAVTCWRSISEQSTGGICSNSYKNAMVIEQGKNWSLLECSPKNVSERSEICIRFNINSERKEEEARACFWRDVNASSSDCCSGVTKHLESINNKSCKRRLFSRISDL